jgi:prepilin-type N-terminal cleavage/methylation domain-containing protein
MKTKTNHIESGFTLIEVIVTFVIVAIVAAMMVIYFGTSFTQSALTFSRLNKAAGLSQVIDQISAKYSQYPHWRPNTTYPAGTIVLPTIQNRTGMLYKTTAGGTSAATYALEPNWLQTSIAESPNGTVTWVPYNAAPTLILQDRKISNNYSVNATILHNGYVYVTRTGGLSGTATLIWPTTVNASVPDYQVTWTCSGGPVTVLSTSPTSPLQLQTEIGAEGTDQTNKTYGSYRVIYNRFIKFDTSNTEYNINTTTSDPLYGWYLKVTIGFRSDDPSRTGQTLTTLFVLR